MGTTSNLLRLERIDPASLNADRPMSAYTAQMVRNNLAHLVDESMQHRINISDAAGLSLGSYKTPGEWTTMPIEFVHSWTGPMQPSNIDLMVSGQTPAGTMTVTARVVPAHYPVGDLSAPNFLTAAGVTGTGTTTSATDAVIISQQAILADASAFVSSLTPIAYVENGAAHTVFIGLMRLELDVKTTSTSTEPVVNRILLREFC